MGITARYKQADVNRELQRGYQAIESGIIRILQRAGEQFVRDARMAMNIDASAFPKGDYLNHTNNLRSSIGYFLLKDGQVIQMNIEGTGDGRNAAMEVISSLPNKGGYQLVGVAGMYYASYVESKGYNVITSQADVAIVNIEKLLNKYRDRMNTKGADVDFNMNDLTLTVMR